MLKDEDKLQHVLNIMALFSQQHNVKLEKEEIIHSINNEKGRIRLIKNKSRLPCFIARVDVFWLAWSWSKVSFSAWHLIFKVYLKAALKRI